MIGCYTANMKIGETLKITSMVLVVVVAVLLIMAVLGLLEGEEIRRGLQKLVAVSGIVVLASLTLAYLGRQKS